MFCGSDFMLSDLLLLSRSHTIQTGHDKRGLPLFWIANFVAVHFFSQ
jgi:hypothetical protein